MEALCLEGKVTAAHAEEIWTVMQTYAKDYHMRAYGRKLIELKDALIQAANEKYGMHVKLEAGRRNQPYLHESNGMILASNIVGDAFNKEIPLDVRKALAKEWKEKNKKTKE